MTLPDERYRAIAQTQDFLVDLMQPSVTPRIPRDIRRRAAGLLKHYPGGWDLDRLAQASPDVLAKDLDPLVRMVLEHREEQSNDHAS